MMPERDQPTDAALNPTEPEQLSCVPATGSHAEELSCDVLKSTVSEVFDPGGGGQRAVFSSFTVPADFEGTKRFQLQGKLGIGGMSTVWRALDTEGGQTVAIKAVHRTLRHNSARLRHEFECLCGLSHAGIVVPYQWHRDAFFSFYTMELLEGLDWLLHARFGPPDSARHNFATQYRPGVPPISSRALTSLEQFNRVRRTLMQLVDGLEYLHRNEIVHCDVKPGNVIVTPDERVVLIDFGLVSTFQGCHRQCRSDIRLAGTVAYMAPELAEFTEPAPSMDWYAVGVMLLEALVGQPPFCGSFEEIMARKRTWRSSDVRDRAPEAPDDLALICENLLQVDPERRLGGQWIRSLLSDPSTRPGQHSQRLRVTLANKKSTQGAPEASQGSQSTRLKTNEKNSDCRR